MRWTCQLVLGVWSVVVLSGCTATREHMAPGAKSLYDRLGGKPVITAVVDDFVVRIVQDSRISRFFAHTDMPLLKAKLVEQICEASGGPCKYTGQDMKTTHQGMGIVNADFDALVEDLSITLDKFRFWVPEKEKNELLAVLVPMRKDITAH